MSETAILQKKPKKHNQDMPSFLRADKETEDITEYLLEKLGKEPMATRAKRRWRILFSITRSIHEKGMVCFTGLVRWVAENCECVKIRTIREEYVEYLAILDVIEWNENTEIITWKGT